MVQPPQPFAGNQPVRFEAPLDDAPPSTQVVVLVWCLWLVGAWGVSLLFSPTVAAARWLVVTALMGLMLVWPAVRLSEGWGRPRPRGPGAILGHFRQGPLRSDPSHGHFRGLSMSAVLVEWLCLVLVFQAVIWPVRILADWRMDQAAWLNGAVLAWSLLSAAAVALGARFNGAAVRATAMMLCAVLVVGEPIVLALAASMGLGHDWSMRISPLPTVWALAQPIVEPSLAPLPGGVITASVAAGAAWIALAVTAATRRRSSQSRPSLPAVAQDGR